MVLTDTDTDTDTDTASVTVRLRHETAAHHARLESLLALLDGSLTRERYTALLERFLGFHRVLEPRLDAWHRANPALTGPLDWPARRKTRLLEADLRALGRPPRPDLALCQDVPAVATTAEAFGVTYVVEGATLGGRLIADHLRDDTALHDALAFFTPYGEDSGRRWRDWRSTVTAWTEVAPARSDHVVAAARTTFEVLGRWLAPAGSA